ncbi:MAG: energy transducer TonB [Bacteroidetes bacterium]|nr:energy transducer TonB [Bacteroidota bacterium]
MRILQKTVIDFTTKTEQEIVDYFAANAGKRTCGKFKTAQLNQPKKIPFQNQHTLKFVAALLLVFGLSLFSCNSDEQQPKTGPTMQIIGNLTDAPVDSAETLPDSIIRKPVQMESFVVQDETIQETPPDPEVPVIEESRIIEPDIVDIIPIQPDIVGMPVGDELPQFPGGEKAMLEYIKQNINYPKSAQDEGLSGKVYVSFKVTETGKIDSVRLLRGFYDSCDMEALRVIRAMPDWKPALRNGKPISVQFNLPIIFKMQ